VVFSSSSA